jgi:GntR family transcriptional regulator / MocR family aminotransferase
MAKSWSTSAALGVDLHLDPAPASGRRSGLEQALRDAIRTGRLAPHTRMPATRKLAAELGLPRGDGAGEIPPVARRLSILL